MDGSGTMSGEDLVRAVHAEVAPEELPFIGQALATLVVEDSAKAAGRALLVRFRKPKPRLTRPVPVIEEPLLTEVRAAAVQAALDRDFPEWSAQRFADAVITN